MHSLPYVRCSKNAVASCSFKLTTFLKDSIYFSNPKVMKPHNRGLSLPSLLATNLRVVVFMSTPIP